MAQSAIINVMTRAALSASKGLLRDFGEVDRLQISRKGVANFVTSADVKAEQVLREELEKARKGYSFLMEESGKTKGTDSEHRWVVDPLDGTTNYIHAIPYFCTSIALQKRNQDGRYESIAGVIYDPIRDEMFTAEKHQGAFLNGRRLQVSPRKQNLLLVTSISRKPKGKSLDEMCDAIDPDGKLDISLRCLGAAALDFANLAAARLDGLWYHSLKPWDIAAGMLIVTEAGGMVTEINGQQNMMTSGSVMATNGHCHLLLQKAIAKQAA